MRSHYAERPGDRGPEGSRGRWGVLARVPRRRAAEVWRIRANPGAAASPASQRGGSKAGHSGPASAPVLAPGSALGVLLSRALSSVQANGDCRCASARRQSSAVVVCLVKPGSAPGCVSAGLVSGACPLGFWPRPSKTVLPLAGITDTGPALEGQPYQQQGTTP